MAELLGRLFWARDFEVFPDIPNEASEASHVSSSVSMGPKGHDLFIKQPCGQPDTGFLKKGVEQRNSEVRVSPPPHSTYFTPSVYEETND